MNNFLKTTTIGLCALALVGVGGCALEKSKDHNKGNPNIEQPAGDTHQPSLASDWFAYDTISETYQVVTGSSVLPTDVVIPSTYNDGINGEALVTTIGEGAFSDCFELTSVTMPNSIISIKNNAFSYCYNLKSITIPASVTSIAEFLENPFIGCSGLESIVVEEGNTVYDSRNNCNALIETATNTLVLGCQTTVIPDTVTTIGNMAFASCYNLLEITIPTSVTTIGSYAFTECFNFTNITIPASVTSIGNCAFINCINLASITIEATTPPEITDQTFLETTCPIYIPAGTLETYTSATYWDALADRLVELEA